MLLSQHPARGALLVRVLLLRLPQQPQPPQQQRLKDGGPQRARKESEGEREGGRGERERGSSCN